MVVSDTVLLFVLLIVLMHRAQSPDTYSALLDFWFASVFARYNTQGPGFGAGDESNAGAPGRSDLPGRQDGLRSLSSIEHPPRPAL
ncbi:MAG: hypothetical protein ABSC90_13305 [Acidimicrobiales bacterium]